MLDSDGLSQRESFSCCGAGLHEERAIGMAVKTSTALNDPSENIEMNNSFGASVGKYLCKLWLNAACFV